MSIDAAAMTELEEDSCSCLHDEFAPTATTAMTNPHQHPHSHQQQEPQGQAQAQASADADSEPSVAALVSELLADKDIERFERQQKQLRQDLCNTEHKLWQLYRAKFERMQWQNWDKCTELHSLTMQQLQCLVYKLTGGNVESVKFLSHPAYASAEQAWMSLSDDERAAALRLQHMQFIESKRCRYCRLLGHSIHRCSVLLQRQCVACGKAGHYVDRCCNRNALARFASRAAKASVSANATSTADPSTVSRFAFASATGSGADAAQSRASQLMLAASLTNVTSVTTWPEVIPFAKPMQTFASVVQNAEAEAAAAQQDAAGA